MKNQGLKLFLTNENQFTKTVTYVFQFNKHEKLFNSLWNMPRRYGERIDQWSSTSEHAEESSWSGTRNLPMTKPVRRKPDRILLWPCDRGKLSWLNKIYQNFTPTQKSCGGSLCEAVSSGFRWQTICSKTLHPSFSFATKRAMVVLHHGLLLGCDICTYQHHKTNLWHGLFLSPRFTFLLNSLGQTTVCYHEAPRVTQNRIKAIYSSQPWCKQPAKVCWSPYYSALVLHLQLLPPPHPTKQHPALLFTHGNDMYIRIRDLSLSYQSACR